MQRSRTMDLPTGNDNRPSGLERESVIIEDEGYQPVRSKLVPNNNPHSSRVRSNASRIGSTATDCGMRKSHAAIEHGLLMQYQAPVLIVKKPKSISGPFDIYDVPQLRMLKDNFRKDYHRQVQNKHTNLTFYNDLDLNGYFTNRNNWTNLSKFQNTSSFYSAVNVYLPLIKNKNVTGLKNKYTSERNSRVASSMRSCQTSALRSSMPSADTSRLGSMSRMTGMNH